jgi:hypothetical protein
MAVRNDSVKNPLTKQPTCKDFVQFFVIKPNICTIKSCTLLLSVYNILSPHALRPKLYHFSIIFSDEPQKKASAPTYPTPSTTWTGEVRGQPAPRPNLDPSSSASPKSALKKTKNELQVKMKL